LAAIKRAVTVAPESNPIARLKALFQLGQPIPSGALREVVERSAANFHHDLIPVYS